MNRSFFHPLAAIALLASFACAPGSHAGSGIAATPWTPAMTTAPTRDQCRAAAHDDRMACFQALLTSVLKREGIDSAMVNLARLAATEQAVGDNNHMYAHMLGLAAYTTPDSVAAVFSRCSPGFQSGCYHGVIQAYFVDLHAKSPSTRIGAAQINSLCKDFRADDNRWLLFQCAHGLGHGLELINAHDLPKSLAGCDLVADWWERSACYGGSFMENIVSVTNPHQTAEGMTGTMEMDDDMAGMDMSTMDHSDTAASFKKFDAKNPLYPCSALDDRYGQQCYLIQTSLMLFINHGDFAAAAQSCLSAPEHFRVDCFVSLGRDANSYAGSRIPAAAKSCALAPDNYRPFCHVGVAKNLVDISSKPADGFAYCAAISESVSKVTCYSAVGEEVRYLAPEQQRRREMCRQAPSPFDAACLYGAGVSGDRPAELAPIP